MATPALLLTFEQVLEDADGSSLSLSLATASARPSDPAVFSYGSLFDRIDYGQLPELHQAFEKVQYPRLEMVMGSLPRAGDLGKVYGVPNDLVVPADDLPDATSRSPRSR